MTTIFDKLLQLPLFQGMTREDFASVVGKVAFHFQKHRAGDILAQTGSSCDKLIFLLKGEVEITTLSDQARYSVTEFVQAPCLIEPDSLFGPSTTFRSTYLAASEADTVTIHKSFILNDLFKYEIFRLNFLNYLCNRAQSEYRKLWENPTGSLEERMGRFVKQHLKRQQGKAILRIKMNDWAEILNETRKSVSHVLNSMQSRNLVELKRGEVHIAEVSNLPG